LGEVTFANARRTDKENIPVLTHELTGGQLIDLSTIDGGVKTEVKPRST